MPANAIKFLCAWARKKLNAKPDGHRYSYQMDAKKISYGDEKLDNYLPAGQAE